MNNLLGYLLSIIYLALVVLVGETINKKNNSKTGKFISRKVIHILTCFEWFIMYYCFGHSYHWIVLCSGLFIGLILGHKFFNSLSDARNRFNGALYYASVGVGLSIMCYFIPSLYIPLGITMCVLSLGDGFAGIIGYLCKDYSVQLINNKSLIGTLMAFSFSFLVILLFNIGYHLDLHIIEMIIISLMFALVELITPFSLDNITTSIVTIGLTLLALDNDILINFAFSLIAIPLVAVLVMKKKSLTRGGVISALVISLIIIACLGDDGFILLFSFFFVTTICDYIKKNNKKRVLKDMYEKVEGRSYKQVLAVGLLPALSSILYLISDNPLFIVIYVSIIAENLADCMASEIGVLSKKRPFDICKMRVVDTGLSGAVSLLGSICSIIGICIISSIYYFLPIYVSSTFYIVFVAALVGVIGDSILGSLVQVKNQCSKCMKITEKKMHCEESTKYYSGIRWVSNPIVNFMSNIVTVVGVIILFVILR